MTRSPDARSPSSERSAATSAKHPRHYCRGPTGGQSSAALTAVTTARAVAARFDSDMIVEVRAYLDSAMVAYAILRNERKPGEQPGLSAVAPCRRDGV